MAYVHQSKTLGLTRNFKVLGVRQNNHVKQVKLGALEYSGIIQAIEIVPHMQVVFHHIVLEQVT